MHLAKTVKHRSKESILPVSLKKASKDGHLASSGMNVPLMVVLNFRTHFCLRFPMKSWSPMRAKTLKQKTVKIITSASFLTDWIRAPTMVFKPKETKVSRL